MQILVLHNGEQLGPFTEAQVRQLVAQGSLARGDSAWYEGLAEWQPLDQIVNFAAVMDAAALPLPQGRRAVLIAGWICAVIGFAIMVSSLWLFFLYIPLYIAAVTLGLVATAQRRIVAGLALVLSTILLPVLVGGFLFITRTSKALDGLQKGYVKFRDETRQNSIRWDEESSREQLATLRTRQAAFAAKQAEMAPFKILESKFYQRSDPAAGGPLYVEVTVENGLTVPVYKAYFRGIYGKPGEMLALLDAGFTKEIPEGLAPGARATWRLEPDEPIYPDVAVDPATLAGHTDAVFTFSVISLDGAEGKPLAGDATFTMQDEARLRYLVERFGGEVEEPAAVTP